MPKMLEAGAAAPRDRDDLADRRLTTAMALDEYKCRRAAYAPRQHPDRPPKGPAFHWTVFMPPSPTACRRSVAYSPPYKPCAEF